MSNDGNQKEEKQKTPKNNMVENIYPFSQPLDIVHSNNKQQTCD